MNIDDIIQLAKLDFFDTFLHIYHEGVGAIILIFSVRSAFFQDFLQEF